MANILLSVRLDTQQATADFRQFQDSIELIAESLQNIHPDKNLTAQINALSRYYSNLARAAVNVQRATDQRRLAEEKLATQVAKTRVEMERAALIEERRRKLNEAANESDDQRAQSIDKLRKSYADLIAQIEAFASKNEKGIGADFEGLRSEAQAGAEAIHNLDASSADYATTVTNLGENLVKLKADFSELKMAYAGDVSLGNTIEKDLSRADGALHTVRIGISNFLATLRDTKKKYPAGTFDTLEKELQGLAASAGNLNREDKDYINSVETLKKKLAEAQEAYAKLRAETDKNTDGVHAHNESLLNSVQAILKWQFGMSLVMKPLRLLRDAWKDLNDTLTETENTVIALQRVLNDPTISNGTIADTLYSIAERFGQTFENVSEIATNFARAGYSWTETIQATEAAVLALNVAELDAGQASDGLIAIMTQFKLRAEDLVDVIDALNKTADNFPVTTEKLLTALQRTGSSAANANLTLEQTIGLITALSEATGRSGANLGTAINSLIQYSSKSGALDVFSAVSPDVSAIVAEYRKGAASILDVWTALSKEIRALTDEQADLLDAYFETSEGQELAKELGSELGDIYDDLAGVYSTANTFRKNYFIALLQNIDTAQEATETALNSMGYSLDENEKYLDTYQAKVNALEAQWKHLANDEQGFLSFKKGLVDIASFLLDIQGNIGGLRTLFIALGATIVTVFGGKALASVKNFIATLKGASGALSATLGWIGLIATALSALVGIVESVARAQAEARRAAIEQGDAIRDEANELARLYEAYKDMNPANAEYQSTEEAIVKLLGEKAQLLGLLTKGTDEYRAAVEKLTEAQLASYYGDAVQAAQAAKTELEKADIPSLATSAALRANNNWDSWESKYGSTVAKRLAQAANYRFAVKYYEQSAAEAIAAGDPALAEKLLGSDTYALYKQGKEALQPYIDEFVNTQIAMRVAEYRLAGNKIQTTDDAEAAIKHITEQLGLGSDYDATIRDAISSLAPTSPSGGGGGGKAKGLSDVWDDIVAKLKEANNEYAEQEKVASRIADIESKKATELEKQLAAEKALKALEEARAERNVRVYNARTGTWEWQANASTVATAQDAYDKALSAQAEAQARTRESEESYDALIYDNAFSEITALTAEGVTRGKIDSIFNSALAKTKTARGQQQLSDLWLSVLNGTPGYASDRAAKIKAHRDQHAANKVAALIGAPSDIDPISSDIDPILKATFDAVFRELGLLSGSSSALPAINPTAVNTTSNTRNYTVNGVPVPTDVADRYTLSEIFDIMPQIN